MNYPLKTHEGILPLVFDGEHILPGGDPFKEKKGQSKFNQILEWAREQVE